MKENRPRGKDMNGRRKYVIINILKVVQSIRAFLHIFLFKISPSQPLILKDIERWLDVTGFENYRLLPKWKGLVWLLWKYPEYRNLFYYRIKREERIVCRILLEVAKLFFPPMECLYIRAGNIGEGLFIEHGYATGISARKIGKNCWINQHVVIGYSDVGKSPTIGDNVQITTGAKIFGDITLGDNSIIGANAVVLKDVPPNCTVVGVPGYIVKRDGKKVKEKL